jgi:hypothetical protein
MGRNRNPIVFTFLICAIALTPIYPVTMARAEGQSQSPIETKQDSAPQSVIIDTDIGGDIDDAYAVGLALQSPELHILGIMTEFENTVLIARLAARFLQETGHPNIPVQNGYPRTARYQVRLDMPNADRRAKLIQMLPTFFFSRSVYTPVRSLSLLLALKRISEPRSTEISRHFVS